jgi:hypothetical protein
MTDWQALAEDFAAQSPQNAERVALVKQEALSHPDVVHTPGNFWRVVCTLLGIGGADA